MSSERKKRMEKVSRNEQFKFQVAYLGSLTESADRKALREAVALYYFTTETFDRKLPGAWSPYDKDSWLPDWEYRRESNRHAIAMRGYLRDTAARLGFGEEDLHLMMKEVVGLSHSTIKAIVKGDV